MDSIFQFCMETQVMRGFGSVCSRHRVLYYGRIQAGGNGFSHD